MNARFQKVEAIFHAALELPMPARRAYIEQACEGDSELLREIESLLEHHQGETAAFRAAVQPVASDLLSTAAVGSDAVPDAMLGPYRVDRKLGEGGMGAVYLTTDMRLGRNVALKVISRRLAGTAEARARFVREARSAAALCHSNIARIYDVGETAEVPWLVMEYVSGASLRSLMTAPLAERAWMHYASQIAAALEHAHTRRIIHRDIKPENILITEDDQVKVIDFGLARSVQDQSAGPATITEANAFVGTFAYAAPELFAGGGASARSDVYSAGVVLYEMACGEHPFAGLKGHALISSISGGNYSPCRTRNHHIQSGIAAVIDRAMSLEPAARYKDGGELAAALENVDATERGGLTDTAPPTLAIIEFKNIGGSAELDWLGTGIAETLSADLAKVRSVRIASRSRVVQSLRRLGSPDKGAATAIELGRDLGARWIVTGGYQQIGERVRVTVTLIHTGTGDALAAEKIDGRWDDLFDVQDRVAAAVLKSLTLQFGTTDRQKILPPETRDIAAYEHYVRGRQQMYEMQGKSLQVAIVEFGEAVRLDPDYALAYSGLGTAHALQFIRTTNPEDIQRASAYLERAIELDPELGEPYPWLANIRVRKNDPGGSFAAGQKGIELQPDLSVAHYFFGALFYMLPEFEPGGLRKEAAHLVEAVRLDRRLHATWLVLGASLMFIGKHADAIRVLKEAVRKESDSDLIYPFVGARTLLAISHTRAGLWDAARTCHLESLDALCDTDHIYTSCFETLSACGLGEIELRCRNESAALTHFRRARRIIGEARRTAGSVRLMIRINAGLAAAYAAIGDQARGWELADEAAAQIENLAGQTATATFECSFAQLWLSVAVAEIRLGNLEGAAVCLARSRENGWLDAAWLRNDPELRPLAGNPNFIAFVQELESAPEPEIPALPFGSEERPQLSSGSA
jgi:serine/threonine protein kinase/tetratricopeptide (TPR) repeat protein